MAEEEPVQERSLLARIRSMGAAAQASVPGIYAWGVTVGPAAWARGGSLFAKAMSIVGLASLAAAIALEPRWGLRARHLAIWGLALSSALVWLVTPAALGPLRLDAARGVTGMVGWALFAFACAAPALEASDAKGRLPGRVLKDAPLRARTQIERGDAFYIVGAVVIALVLQLPGWGVVVPERALLVRFVALVGALAILGAAVSISLARHGRAPRRSRQAQRVRIRKALPWLVLLVMLAGAGALVWLRA